MVYRAWLTDLITANKEPFGYSIDFKEPLLLSAMVRNFMARDLYGA